MNNTSLLLCIFAILQSNNMCSAQNHSGKNEKVKSELHDAVIKSNFLYGRAFERNDSSIFIARYDPNAWIMAPNTQSLTGPGAASRFYKTAYFDLGIRNVILTTFELYQQNDYATELGSFELRDSLNKIIGKGKYLVLWKRTSGQWKMFRDCFNSDLP